MVQELQGFDRSLVDHVDHLEVPCHGAPLDLQDVVQSGDGALEVLALADDAATPGSDNCAVLHLLGSGAVQVYSDFEGFLEVRL